MLHWRSEGLLGKASGPVPSPLGIYNPEPGDVIWFTIMVQAHVSGGERTGICLMEDFFLDFCVQWLPMCQKWACLYSAGFADVASSRGSQADLNIFKDDE